MNKGQLLFPIMLVALLLNAPGASGQEESEGKKEVKQSGYINITEFNFCSGIGYVKSGTYSELNDEMSWGIKNISAILASEGTSVGIGIGFDAYENETLMPVTADMRLKLIKGRYSPGINTCIGYSLGLDTDEKGLTMGISAGFKAYLSKSIALMFNIGYKMQEKNVDVVTQYYYFSTVTEEQAKLNFLYLGFAICL